MLSIVDTNRLGVGLRPQRLGFRLPHSGTERADRHDRSYQTATEQQVQYLTEFHHLLFLGWEKPPFPQVSPAAKSSHTVSPLKSPTVLPFYFFTFYF